MTKKTKWLIFRKIIAGVLLIAAAIGIVTINQVLAAFDNRVEVDASMDVMSGNSSTVSGVAVMQASANVLNIIRIILWAVVLLLIIYFGFDLIKDGKKQFKNYFS